MLHNFKCSLQKSFADWLGIVCSLACALHCMVFPVLIIYLSWLGNMHHMLEYAFVGIAFIAVVAAAKSMTKTLKTWLWFSFALFSTAMLLHEISGIFQYLSLLGSIGLVICHLQNLSRKKVMPLVAKSRS